MMDIASSPSANNPAFGIFCNPESRRVEGFCAASAKLLGQYPVLVPWQQVLEKAPWKNRLSGQTHWLRLESPGRNWVVEKALLLRGAAVEDEESNRNWDRLSIDQVRDLQHDLGRIYPIRQWFLGWRSLLQEVSAWASHSGLSDRWMSPPEDVLAMYDKAECQRLFESAQISTPPSLGIPSNFDELWESMKRSGFRRVFLKPCHGSGATGVVAIESSGHRLQAHSTLELVDSPDGARLYNRRQIKTHRDLPGIRRLIDEVCRQRSLAQAWIPKAGLHGRPFDLRIVVIGPVAQHSMVRLGRGPITNSQLLGGKGDLDLLRSKMTDGAWEKLRASCQRAASQCFGGCLYVAFDVLVEPDFQTTHILEANAFGDLLPRIQYNDMTTYEAEIAEAMLQAANSSRVVIGLK